MAPVNPPTHLQSGSYSSRLDRLHTGGLLTPDQSRGGLVPRSGTKPAPGGSGMSVSQRSTPDRWVTVSSGTLFISSASTSGGVYECHNDGSYDVQIAAAHGSLARRDLVVGRVYDATDGSGATNEFKIEVITGTAAGSPSLPPNPLYAVPLAEVQVPAGSSTVTSANIIDMRYRTVALGGVLPVRASWELPTAPYRGMTVFREDLGQMQTWNGTAWRGYFDTDYSFAYGCLGFKRYDANPNFATNSTTGVIVKHDGTNNSRITFTIPAGVPASRMLRIETVFNMNTSPALTANARVWAGHYLDGAAMIGNDRRVYVPNDSFYYQTTLTTLVEPSWTSVGTHYVEPRLRVDNSAVTVTLTSLEMAVYLL